MRFEIATGNQAAISVAAIKGQEASVFFTGQRALATLRHVRARYRTYLKECTVRNFPRYDRTSLGAETTDIR